MKGIPERYQIPYTITTLVILFFINYFFKSEYYFSILFIIMIYSPLAIIFLIYVLKYHPKNISNFRIVRRLSYISLTILLLLFPIPYINIIGTNVKLSITIFNYSTDLLLILYFIGVICISVLANIDAKSKVYPRNRWWWDKPNIM